MTFTTVYYPIPAGVPVACSNCHALLRDHLDEHGGWRGCPLDAEKLNGRSYSVWLVSTCRRATDEKAQYALCATDAVQEAKEAARTVEKKEEGKPAPTPHGDGEEPEPPALAAGPRAAVYRQKPGTKVRGMTGQAAAVLDALHAAGKEGLTSAELRKALGITPKSLESVLYRLRLRGLIQAYRFEDVRK